MENLEDIATTGRVTRSLRKRLTSVDSSETGSRPTTPLPQKLTAISELNSPSRPARMTRRNSTTSAATPAKSRTFALTESTVDVADTPARRSTRKRSISISEDTPSKVGNKPNVAQPKFDTLTEEDTKRSSDVPNSQKRVTRGQSKSPQQQDLVSTTSFSSKVQRAYKPAPKSKMHRRQYDDSDSDVEIISVEQANEDVKESVKNDKSVAEETIQKHIESPKLRTEQLGKASVQSPKASPLNKSTGKAGVVPISETDKQQSGVIELLDDTVTAEEIQTPLDIKIDEDPKEALNKKDTSIQHIKQTPERNSNAIEKKQTPSKHTTITTPQKCAPKSPVNVVEVVRLCPMSPQTMVMLASPVKSHRSSPVKSKSVTFNESDVDDSVVKGVYPRTPFLAKSKSYIDIDSSKEADDRSFQSDKASVASFKDANEHPESGRSSRTDAADNSKESLVYHDATNGNEEEEHIDDMDEFLLDNKTPHKSKLLIEHTSSTPVIEAEARNGQKLKRASMEAAVEEIVTNDDTDLLIEHTSSMPVIEAEANNGQKLKRASMEAAVEEIVTNDDTDLLDKSLRSGKKYGDSPKSAQKSASKLNTSASDNNSPKRVNPLSDSKKEDQNISTPIRETSKVDTPTPTDDKKVTSTVEELADDDRTEKVTSMTAESSFAKSWSQGVSGQANNTKIDTISIKVTPNKSAVEKTPEPKSKIEAKKEEGALKEDAESEEEKDQSYEKIWFIEDEAMAANEDYCSGDSLTAEERQEIEENKIEVDGESIGSEDTLESMADEESDNENASFVTSDSENEVLLEYSDDDEHLKDEPDVTVNSFKRIKTVSTSSNDTETNVTKENAEKAKPLNTSGDAAALTLDVSKMIDETLNGGELAEAGENGETKKRRSSTGSGIKKSPVSEQTGKTVDLNKSPKDKRKSLNKSTSEASEHNKSADKVAADNLSASKEKSTSTAPDINLMGEAASEQANSVEVADDVLSRKIGQELKLCSAFKDLINPDNMNVIVIKRASVGVKESPSVKKAERTSHSGYAASKAAFTSSSSSEDEDEIQHKSLNSSRKINGNGKKDRRKPVVSSDSSDEETEELPVCQSLRMQRAEVFSSSEEDEVVENTLNSSEKGTRDSLEKIKPTGDDAPVDGTEGTSANITQNSRNSLNDSLQANGKSSQTNRRLSKSLQENNNNNVSSSNDDVKQGSVRKGLRKQRAEVYEFSDDEDESEHAKLVESNKEKSFGQSKNAELLVQSKKSPIGKQRTSIQSDIKSVNKHNSHERNIEANADDADSSEDSIEESESDADEKSKSKRRSTHNISQKGTTEDSTESESDEDSDNEGNDEEEEVNSVLKPTKAASGLSVSFGQVKKDKTKDVLSGKIRHSSFTIGVTVAKNASNMPQQSESTEEEEDSIEQTSSTAVDKGKPLSSDEEQHLEMLARTERAGNITGSKRRQSLAPSQTAEASPLPKKSNRKSLCHTQKELHPSQSFIESIGERKRALQEERAAKQRRLSKSLCEATVAAEDKCNALDEFSPKKKNVNTTTVEGSDLDKQVTEEMKSTSTPRADNAAKNRIEDILGRCDQILEAANQAKLESKRNFHKSKIAVTKKKKVSKEENVAKEDDLVPSATKNETKFQEKTKKALEQALKASANILLKPKKDNLTAQIDKKQWESKRLPMQLLEAVAKTEPKSLKKRNKDSPLNYDNESTLHSTHKVKSTSGYLIEEALTPPVKKRAPINKFELPSGVVYEEPVTPKREKKSMGGFHESPVTPRTIGFKVRRMLTAGQDLPPTMPTQQTRKERKRKHVIEEPKLTLPKPKWTQSGEFLEEELPTAHKVSRIGSTDFLVSALNGARKEKAKKLTAVTACSNALNFKKMAMQRDNVPRESSHEVLLRKERQRMHSNY